jgi:hypothetical protein
VKCATGLEEGITREGEARAVGWVRTHCIHRLCGTVEHDIQLGLVNCPEGQSQGACANYS